MTMQTKRGTLSSDGACLINHRCTLQAALVAVVEGAGFEARTVGRGALADCDSALLRISGMTCSSCSSAVEAALASHKGVQVCAPCTPYLALQTVSSHTHRLLNPRWQPACRMLGYAS